MHGGVDWSVSKKADREGVRCTGDYCSCVVGKCRPPLNHSYARTRYFNWPRRNLQNHIAEGRLDNRPSKAHNGSDGAFANFRLAGATEKNGTLLGGPGVVRRGVRHRPLPAQPRALSAQETSISGRAGHFYPRMIWAGNSLSSGAAMWGMWPMAILDPWCNMITAFRGEAIRCTKTVTVRGTSRIRTPIQPRAPRRRFLGLYRIGIPTRSAAGGTDGSVGVMGYFQRPTCSRIS